MADEHKLEAAALLDQAGRGRMNSEGRVPRPSRQELIEEALVHAVLHLADVLEVRQAIHPWSR